MDWERATEEGWVEGEEEGGGTVEERAMEADEGAGAASFVGGEGRATPSLVSSTSRSWSRLTSLKVEPPEGEGGNTATSGTFVPACCSSDGAVAGAPRETSSRGTSSSSSIFDDASAEAGGGG